MSDLISTVLDPHLKQYATVAVKSDEFDIDNRILHKMSPREPYQQKERSTRTALHWGQRKLLMSEIEFLTLYGNKADLVVYAGAAGGYHIPFLSAMFPDHLFHLYDPAKFAIKESEKIKIFNEKMTNDVAATYANRDVLYISDIRTVASPDPVGKGEEEKAERLAREYAVEIAKDNAMQLSWSQVMNPKASMVKFKLPYEDIDGKNYTIYPKGKIFLPVWGRPSTTECRLIYTNPHGLRKYFHKKYEEQLAYFNNNTLLSYYPHQYDQNTNYHPTGIDHCYSCRAELYILEEYVRKSHQINNDLVIRSMVKNLSESLSPHLNPNKLTLLTKTLERKLNTS
jgi:cap2 methyltransferase